MMDVGLIVPLLTVLVFCVVQFIEMKFVEKRWRAPKVIVRDTIVVLICSLVANFVFANVGDSIQGFVDAITDKKTVAVGMPEVYTDAPLF